MSEYPRNTKRKLFVNYQNPIYVVQKANSPNVVQIDVAHSRSLRVGRERLFLDVAGSERLESKPITDEIQQLAEGSVMNLGVWQIRGGHLPFL